MQFDLRQEVRNRLPLLARKIADGRFTSPLAVFAMPDAAPEIASRCGAYEAVAPLGGRTVALVVGNVADLAPLLPQHCRAALYRAVSEAPEPVWCWLVCIDEENAFINALVPPTRTISPSTN